MSRGTSIFASFLLMAAAVATVPQSAHAGGLNPAHVPADAKWVMHFDYEHLGHSALAKQIRETYPGFTKAIQGWVKQRYGMELPDGLESITAYSDDYKQYTGRVIIRGNYDQKKLRELMGQAEGYSASEFEGYTLHTMLLKRQPQGSPSGDKELTIVTVDDQTVLLASSEKNAQKALRLMADFRKSLKGKQSPLLTERATEAWIYGAAIDLGELSDHPVAMPILWQHERITWEFGKRDEGNFYESAQLVAQSDQVAEKMKDILEGIVACETLVADKSEPMTALMENVSIYRDGKTAGFDWQGDPEEVSAAMGDAMKRLRTWLPVLAEGGQMAGRQQQTQRR